MKDKVTYHMISDQEDPARAGFVEVYKAAFAEAPYFEEYDNDWITTNVWNTHLSHILIVAKINDQIAGLGCAHPVLEEMSTVGTFLEEKERDGTKIPFPLETTIYMSELAVSGKFRKHGIGSKLIKLRHEKAKEIGFSHYCMRTAADGSNSRSIYESMGAQSLPFTQPVNDEGIDSQSESRIILYGEL